MLVGLFLVAFCVLGQFRAKADLHIALNDVTFPILDPIYFDAKKTECSIAENSSGESIMSCNIAVIRTFPNDTYLHEKILGLSMGEFLVPSGIDLNIKLCDALDELIILAPFFLTLFPTKTCPPEPNVYVTKDYVVPLHLLPDSFVENNYKLSIELKHRKKPIMKAETIFELSY